MASNYLDQRLQGLRQDAPRPMTSPNPQVSVGGGLLQTSQGQNYLNYNQATQFNQNIRPAQSVTITPQGMSSSNYLQNAPINPV